MVRFLMVALTCMLWSGLLAAANGEDILKEFGPGGALAEQQIKHYNQQSSGQGENAGLQRKVLPQWEPSYGYNDYLRDQVEFARDQVDNQRWTVVMLCGVALGSLVIVLTFLFKTTQHTAGDIVNATGLTLIIFGTIILVLVVQTSEQLTAAIGVLGAIAGYLFGSLQRKGAGEE